jgi:hypothetical protein
MENENKRATDEAKRRQDEFKQQQDEIRKKQQGGTPPNAIERQVTQTNLSQIGLKFIGYNEGKNFPMSSVKGEGKLSWRVAILEDIDRNHYNLFKHNEAWNSPHNMKILNTTSMPSMFKSGRMKPGEDRKTYFRLFTGPGTLYPAANSRPKMDMITAGAGASNTWLLAEGKNAVEWTKPDELIVNGGQFPQLGGARRTAATGQPNAGRASGGMAAELSELRTTGGPPVIYLQRR